MPSYLAKLEAELAEATAKLDGLKRAVAKSHEEICQIAGKELGYPWFKDDQKNFPGATEECGVCVGEHVAETIVAELAKSHSELKRRVQELESFHANFPKVVFTKPLDTLPGV